jgi:ribosomal protein L11 methyltransferase
MDTFWIVTLFHYQPSPGQWVSLESHAVNDFSAAGIEEFSLDEPAVDELLGARSYSGGDLPQDVLDEVEDRVLGAPNNYRFFFTDGRAAADFLAFVRRDCLCESQLEERRSEDWNAEWKKHYAPIPVNEKLEVIPSWSRDYRSASERQIYIYPGMGFGTGSHETTFLCLRLFTEHLLGEKVATALDFGSGSGILGLSVFRFFPDARVDFYDVDPEANKNCYQNAEINDLQDRAFRLLLPEVRDRFLSAYDVVFANILESILLQERDQLCAAVRPGGALILSGLLRPQAATVIAPYRSRGFVLREHLEKGDWAALLFENPAR